MSRLKVLLALLDLHLLPQIWRAALREVINHLGHSCGPTLFHPRFLNSAFFASSARCRSTVEVLSASVAVVVWLVVRRAAQVEPSRLEL